MKKKINKQISRGEFLKIGSIGFISLASSPFSFSNILKNPSHQYLITEQENNLHTYGRVLDDFAHVYPEPTFDSSEIHTYKKDSILPIRTTIQNADQPDNSQYWFKIKENAFVPRSNLQPVKINFNPVVEDISVWGALAEVTIPYTNAFPSPSFNQLAKTRYYYQSHHWVKNTVIDSQGRAWYEIKDDKDQSNPTYVPAKHLRILPYEEFNQLSPGTPAEEKRIEVHLEGQFIIAYEFDKPVFSTKASMGDIEKNENYDTPTGTFNTHYKRPSQHLLANNNSFGGYDLPGVPWINYINPAGIAFHGAYWHNDFGQPKSHGCINLKPDDAKWIYRWTTPFVSPNKELLYNSDTSVGTRVDII